MRWLAENALPIWIGGAIALTMAGVVYFQTRTKGSLISVLGVCGVTAALLLFNWLVETPREAVNHALYRLAATVEANDVAGALSQLAPTANSQLRKDVETLMPQVRIEMARILGEPKIELNTDETAANVECRGFIQATNKRDGMKGDATDRFVLQWVHRGDHWLLENYTSQKDWNGAVRQLQKVTPPASTK
ncbi:MAG TPA: hypothetical protein VH107_00915 [Lacipirellulaceae bacterium]|jgi:hypothetical protein|nr:hypothetical protein [Lacipirellulaceae bacterium]